MRLRPLHPPVQPVTQAYAAGEGLSSGQPARYLLFLPPTHTLLLLSFSSNSHPLQTCRYYYCVRRRCSSAAEKSTRRGSWSVLVFPPPPLRLPRSLVYFELIPAPFLPNASPLPCHRPRASSVVNPGSFCEGGPRGRDPSSDSRVTPLFLLRWLGLLRHDVWTPAVGEHRR